MIGIYAITHVASGRCYIGSSISIERRFKEHVKDLRTGKHFNPHLQHAWSLYGEDAFVWSVIEATDYEARLSALEQFHLDAFRPNVYNADGPVDCPWRGKKRTLGHTAKLVAQRIGKPRPHTPEQRAKIVASNKSRTGQKMSPEAVENLRRAKTGVKIGPFSAETRAKMSIVAQNRQYSTETRARMRANKLGKKRKPVTEETRKRMAEARRLVWAKKKAIAS